MDGWMDGWIVGGRRAVDAYILSHTPPLSIDRVPTTPHTYTHTQPNTARRLPREPPQPATPLRAHVTLPAAAGGPGAAAAKCGNGSVVLTEAGVVGGGAAAAVVAGAGGRGGGGYGGGGGGGKAMAGGGGEGDVAVRVCACVFCVFYGDYFWFCGAWLLGVDLRGWWLGGWVVGWLVGCFNQAPSR
jgi:hypothetical protein